MDDDGTLTIFSKADCPLCDEGFAIVRDVARRYGLGVRKVDIASDPALLQRHRYRVPVVLLRGRELGWGRLTRAGIERALREE